MNYGIQKFTLQWTDKFYCKKRKNKECTPVQMGFIFIFLSKSKVDRQTFD